MALNKWLGIGRLTAPPELKTTQSGIEVCSFTMAVNRPYQKDKEQKADFIRCTAWRGTATFISNYFTKGSPIQIEGAIRIEDGKDKDGNPRQYTSILVQEVAFVEGAKKQEAPDDTGYSGFDDFEQYVPDGEEDLPF